MSKDKSVTTATIKFYANKHIEVELDDLKNVHPRAINIANNLLLREYLAKRAQFNSAEHKAAREAKAAEEKNRLANEAKFHEDEDKRLAAAAKDKEKRMKEFQADREKHKEAEMAQNRERIAEREKAETDSEA